MSIPKTRDANTTRRTQSTTNVARWFRRTTELSPCVSIQKPVAGSSLTGEHAGFYGRLMGRQDACAVCAIPHRTTASPSLWCDVSIKTCLSQNHLPAIGLTDRHPQYYYFHLMMEKKSAAFGSRFSTTSQCCLFIYSNANAIAFVVAPQQTNRNVCISNGDLITTYTLSVKWMLMV